MATAIRPSTGLKLKILLTAEPLGLYSTGIIENGSLMFLCYLKLRVRHPPLTWNPLTPPPPIISFLLSVGGEATSLE